MPIKIYTHVITSAEKYSPAKVSYEFLGQLLNFSRFYVIYEYMNIDFTTGGIAALAELLSFRILSDNLNYIFDQTLPIKRSVVFTFSGRT